MSKRVAFFLLPHANWIGGTNYYKNMFIAFNSSDDLSFEPIILSASPLTDGYFSFLKSTKFLTIVDCAFATSFSTTLKFYIKRYKIDYLSHMGIFSDYFDAKVINWIPDFQHKYLPDFFTPKELSNRNRLFPLYAKYANTLILSSNTAKNDFNSFYPSFEKKSYVLPFVSTIDLEWLYSIDKNYILKKYDVKHYFYLPNQFWQHKNHFLVFKAIKKMKEKGLNPTVLCSGLLDDYRNTKYMKDIKNYIKKNKLSENIHLLGIIPHSDVFLLILHSISVINVSLFEGWSTTVEECKTIGKGMILSNIDVHKEQAPNNSTYVSTDNVFELEKVLSFYWKNYDNPVESSNIENITTSLNQRQNDFVEQYSSLVL